MVDSKNIDFYVIGLVDLFLITFSKNYDNKTQLTIYELRTRFILRIQP